MNIGRIIQAKRAKFRQQRLTTERHKLAERMTLEAPIAREARLVEAQKKQLAKMEDQIRRSEPENKFKKFGVAMGKMKKASEKHRAKTSKKGLMAMGLANSGSSGIQFGGTGFNYGGSGRGLQMGKASEHRTYRRKIVKDNLGRENIVYIQAKKKKGPFDL